ncbi:uncharacterized protein LOC62_02G003367 [Vanrija pseudolonga]|uniref:Uncharacterized protein n=1 Tax=Vanrija pseudolonga TaxID=143232 RepID=A0AAF0Y4G1_9TREE|nr:hypothetical protein LOC62_02G003367 [Vanrija pseudolonga]
MVNDKNYNGSGQPAAANTTQPRTTPYAATTHISTGILAVDDYLNNNGEVTPVGIIFSQDDLNNAVNHGYTVYRMELDPYDDWLSFEQFADMYYDCVEAQAQAQSQAQSQYTPPQPDEAPVANRPLLPANKPRVRIRIRNRKATPKVPTGLPFPRRSDPRPGPYICQPHEYPALEVAIQKGLSRTLKELNHMMFQHPHHPLSSLEFWGAIDEGYGLYRAHASEFWDGHDHPVRTGSPDMYITVDDFYARYYHNAAVTAMKVGISLNLICPVIPAPFVRLPAAPVARPIFKTYRR